MKLRFTIRDLFWLVVLAAVLVAWWLDRKHLAADRTAWKSAVYAEEDAESARSSYQVPPSNADPVRSASPREREREKYRPAPEIVNQRGLYPR